MIQFSPFVNPENCALCNKVPIWVKKTETASRLRVRIEAVLDWAPVERSSEVITPELKDGCTVEGEATGTTFTYVDVDIEADATLIKLFLQGFKQGLQVREE